LTDLEHKYKKLNLKKLVGEDGAVMDKGRIWNIRAVWYSKPLLKNLKKNTSFENKWLSKY
jgi:hypothetical protein